MGKPVTTVLLTLFSIPMVACDYQPLCSYGCGEPEKVSENVVGSRDCEMLQDLDKGHLCAQCQGTFCEEGEPQYPLIGCGVFPCVDGARVVQGCKDESHCAEFDGMRCMSNICGPYDI